MNAASRRLIDFIRTAPHDAQGLYTFQIKGTATDAQKFVHRMRVVTHTRLF